jgi:hypothetical protein
MNNSLSASVVLPGGYQATFALSSDGSNTTLTIQTAGAGGSSSSSSSAGTGAWTAQPTIVSDGHSRVGVLIEGVACCAVFAVQAGVGGTSVSSMSLDRAAFGQRFGAGAGFVALPWAAGVGGGGGGGGAPVPFAVPAHAPAHAPALPHAAAMASAHQQHMQQHQQQMQQHHQQMQQQMQMHQQQMQMQMQQWPAPAPLAAVAPAVWPDAAAVARLCEMGFDAGAVHSALRVAAGDENAAAGILLSA